MVLVQKEIKRITIRPNGTEKQIRPADTYHYYTPTANTLLYYPLRDDINDYSGNGYNLTVASGGTITYSNNMAIIANDSLFYGTALLPSPGGFTVGCRCYPSSWNGIHEDDSGGPLWQLSNDNGDYKGNFKIGGTWHRLGSTTQVAGPCHIMVTRNGSTFTLYMNGQYDSTFSSSGTIASRPNGFRISYFDNGVGGVIMENIAWSAQDVLDHYNYTKSNYGL